MQEDRVDFWQYWHLARKRAWRDFSAAPAARQYGGAVIGAFLGYWMLHTPSQDILKSLGCAFLGGTAILVAEFLLPCVIFTPPKLQHDKDRATKMAQADAEILRKEKEDKDKQKLARLKLSLHLSEIEERIREISVMLPQEYIDSIAEEKDKSTALYGLRFSDFDKTLRALEDKRSMAIINATASDLELYVEPGKSARFASQIGFVASPRENWEGILPAYQNKQTNMLDNLRHWAKNLLEIIKELS
jgi:hypothetical protein